VWHVRSAALVIASLVVVGAACRQNTGTVVPQLQPPPASIDAGVVPVLNTSIVAIPVLSVGRAPLNISNVKMTEGQGPFTLMTFPTDPIATDNDNPILVSFVPPEEQSYEAKVSFDTDDTDNPSIVVTLTGAGSTRAVMQVDPMTIDFGRVAECSSALQTFTITSAGTADLIVEEIDFVDGGSPAFSRVGSWNTPVTIPHKDKNGLPGSITLTVKMTVAQGMHDPQMGGIHIRGTDPDHRDVVVPLTGTVNQAPIPLIGPLGNGAPGETVQLDGGGSYDPDGDSPLTYKWTLRSAPISAMTMITPPDQPYASMMLDPITPGGYEVQLDVTDSAGAKNCAPARETVVAAPAEKLLVEMFWDNQITDMDLHVLRTTTSVLDRLPDDCYYANKNPDWGVLGDPSDDPQLERDALTGYGPEIFGYKNPIASTFRVVAVYQSEHLAMNPNTNITVRVYVYGVVKFEQTKLLTAAGQTWPAVDIDWPSGNVTPVP
jgi:hypothetical protein